MSFSIKKLYPWATPIFFGMRLQEQHYNDSYQKGRLYNGPDADVFVIKTLTRHFPDRCQTTVWDIGSGQGRNTLLMAQLGYRVISTEISDAGRQYIQTKATETNIGDRIHLDKTNILEPENAAHHSSLKGQPIHLAVMSRVSMHFSLKEMKQVLAQVWQKLSPNGLFIFNALLRRPNYEPINKNLLDSDLEHSGANNFEPDALKQAIETANFEIETIEAHETPRTSDPSYMKQIYWGVHDKVFNKESPVELKWYALRKPVKSQNPPLSS